MRLTHNDEENLLSQDLLGINPIWFDLDEKSFEIYESLDGFYKVCEKNDLIPVFFVFLHECYSWAYHLNKSQYSGFK